MLRRKFLQATAGAFSIHVKAAPVRRNILFFAIDDLNDWIGCLGGHPQARTPNLDRLASQGVLFTNAHCAAPLCNPSRAALMTGLRPSTTGVYDNNQPFRNSARGPEALTLPQYLRQHGYRAVASGKIYHEAFPDPASWDENVRKPADPKPPATHGAGAAARAHFDWGPLETPSEDMPDMKTMDWGIRQLSAKVTDPLFLALGISKPHLPWYIPKKYFDLFPLDRIELPATRNDDLDDIPAIGRRFALANGDHGRVTEAGVWKSGVQAYLAAIAFADDCVGKLMRALETGPNAGNFTTLLWSDHGWHLGEKSHWRKFTLWEESTRSVLMCSAPGITKPGGRCGRTVSYMDIYPTISELCGVPVRQENEGVSFLPQLKDPSAARTAPAIITYQRGNHAVRDERWRYIRYRDGGEELYDRSKDPMEWTNLAAKPELAEVKQRLAGWLPKTDAPDAPNTRGAGAAQ